MIRCKIFGHKSKAENSEGEVYCRRCHSLIKEPRLKPLWKRVSYIADGFYGMDVEDGRFVLEKKKKELKWWSYKNEKNKK